MSKLSLFGASEYILGGIFSLVFVHFGPLWGVAVAVASLPIRLHTNWLTTRAIRRDRGIDYDRLAQRVKNARNAS